MGPSFAAEFSKNKLYVHVHKMYKYYIGNTQSALYSDPPLLELLPCLGDIGSSSLGNGGELGEAFAAGGDPEAVGTAMPPPAAAAAALEACWACSQWARAKGGPPPPTVMFCRPKSAAPPPPAAAAAAAAAATGEGWLKEAGLKLRAVAGAEVVEEEASRLSRDPAAPGSCSPTGAAPGSLSCGRCWWRWFWLFGLSFGLLSLLDPEESGGCC